MSTVPLTPVEGNVAAADLDSSRSAHLDPAEPHQQIDSWRAEHITDTSPPPGYLEEP